MYKKSYFRGLGTGLVIGALTMTVAFNFGNAGKTDSGQGKFQRRNWNRNCQCTWQSRG